MKEKLIIVLAALTLLASMMLLWWLGGAAGAVADNAPVQAAAPGIAPMSALMNVSSVEPGALVDSSVESSAPPDVPVEEWRRLTAALATNADGQRQLARVGEYLTFKHRAEKWRQSKASDADADSRAELSQYLLDNLSLHLARREVTAGEAQLMVAALLQDRVSDPVQLRQAVQAQMDNMKAVQPAADPQLKAQEQAQMAAYQQREAAILAQWQAMPEARRNQQWLEQQLDQARQDTLQTP